MIYPYSEAYAKKYNLPYEKKQFLNLGQIINDILPGFGDAFQKLTGSGLTTAEKEANEFSHNEAELAYERELAADSTKHQREVQDLIAAGINPMLAAGASGGSVHTSPVSSTAPSSSGDLFGSLLSFALQSKNLGIQRMVADQQVAESKAREANIETDTTKKAEETRSIQLQNEITEATKDAEIESKKLANQLTRENINLVQKKADEAAEHIHLMAEQAESEVEKQAMFQAETILKKASAYEITQLLPYRKQLMAAQTEEARNAALLSAAHCAYQNKLIDDGYIDNFIREQVAKADIADAEVAVADIKQGLRTGNFKHSSQWSNQVPGVLKGLAIVLDNFNPIADIFN